ncbi:hypothetical protein ANN_14726 [Periplaneta americana]|uniref:Uncharacterized protein n=1 Tax=Periplaneta americana TaxID=6978 RepID=A0ABQ8SX35_PERAM|nr:hypothetical protein ANN_14726 [Periplaneta americana]
MQVFVVVGFYLLLMMDGVNSVTCSVHVSVESGVFVSIVVYSTDSSIRFHQHVVTLDFVAISFLSLFLDVVSVWILHSVLELVLWVCLLKKIVAVKMNAI